MEIHILYRPKSEAATATENFQRELTRRYPDLSVRLTNCDDRDGLALSQLYDIMAYPAILVTTQDGQLQQLWQGTRLPLIDEVAAYSGLGR